MKKIGIFTWHKVDSAYSCLWYLKENLEKKFSVDLWAFNSKEEFNVTNYYSLKDRWYGNIRRIRVYLSKLKVFNVARNYDVVIINDLDYFFVGYLLKSIYPQKIVVLYHTEIYAGDVKCSLWTRWFYKKNADYPDMIIECLKERADYRKRLYNISKNIYVIDNTIPEKEIENALQRSNVNIDQYINFNGNEPILVYAGGCNLSRCLGDVIQSASQFKGKLNYLFFVYGSDKDYSKVELLCKKHDNCRLFRSVDRKTLLSIMRRCDIGIQYYDPNYSINHYLASPSKFFEYIGSGLNVISTKNSGIDKIIEENDLGICLEPGEGISEGIERLLKKGLRTREYVRGIFRNKYCYEIDAKETLEELEKLIASNGNKIDGGSK